MTNNVIDTYNAVTGSIVAVLSYILGEHWILFVAYLALNVADQFTGWMGAKIFVEAGYNVPKALTKGLEVADKVVNKDQEEE